MNKDSNYYAPGKFAWLFGEDFRAAVAVFSLVIVAAALGVYSWRLRRARGATGSSAPSRVLAVTALRDKIIWYPVIQSLTRIPCIYIILYGSLKYMDKNQKGDPTDDSARKTQNTSRVSLAYIYAVLSPSGGFLMFILFMRNNVAARKWLQRLLWRPPRETATTLAESTTAVPSSGAFPEQPTTFDPAQPAETEDQLRVRFELLTSRCADLDEEQLVQKLAENNGRSEEAWQASLLQDEAHVTDFVPEPTYASHPRHVSDHREDWRARTSSQQTHAAPSDDVDVGVQLTAVAPLSHFRQGAAGYVAPAGTHVATVEINNATVDNPLYSRQHREHPHPCSLNTPAPRLPFP